MQMLRPTTPDRDDTVMTMKFAKSGPLANRNLPAEQWEEEEPLESGKS